jgi:hypothetical protein
MKTISILLLSLYCACINVSCSTAQQAAQTVEQQAKSNLSVGLNTGKSPVGNGYEVNGHASTNIFGVHPYVSFTAGLAYVPVVASPPPVVVTPQK